MGTELQTIPGSDVCDSLRCRGPVSKKLAQVAEETLGPGRADHLDHAGRNLPGVPHRVQLLSHRVQLATWVGDVSATAEHDFPVAGAKADFSFGDDGVFVLPGVQVRRDQRADRERMLDDGHCPVGVSAGRLEGHPDGAEVPGQASPGRTMVSGGAWAFMRTPHPHQEPRRADLLVLPPCAVIHHCVPPE